MEGYSSDRVCGQGVQQDEPGSVPWLGSFHFSVLVETIADHFEQKGKRGIWACEYYPPGNVIGQFAQNVQK